jgi:hypothetical protein
MNVNADARARGRSESLLARKAAPAATKQELDHRSRREGSTPVSTPPQLSGSHCRPFQKVAGLAHNLLFNLSTG